jgi:hypothetical protein
VGVQADGEEQRGMESVLLNIAREQQAAELGGEGGLLTGAHHCGNDFIGRHFVAVFADRFTHEHGLDNGIVEHKGSPGL